jgi:hypothetical protein
LDHNDVDTFGRSVAGWFDSTYGDARLTFFGSDRGLSWWAWVVLIGWLVAVAVAGVAWISNRRWLPEPLTVCLVAAGLLTGALVCGMLFFDALVFPDNRLMLPAGVLTLCGMLWSWTPRSTQALWAGGAAVAAWLVVAAGPFDAPLGASRGGWLERFSDSAGAPAYVTEVIALDAAIVVSNDADGIHWHTGKPAVYLPQPTKALTGETVDVAAEYDELPCALLRGDGVVVVVEGALVGADAVVPLEALVGQGRLQAVELTGATLYRPASTSCG